MGRQKHEGNCQPDNRLVYFLGHQGFQSIALEQVSTHLSMAHNGFGAQRLETMPAIYCPFGDEIAHCSYDPNDAIEAWEAWKAMNMQFWQVIRFRLISKIKQGMLPMI
ncbi:MAG: hypothetical protein P4N60_08825 [Verrucomicrobiae bacterium]|nr:hypothetical protein [Verrucomicrobiae bacterium]